MLFRKNRIIKEIIPFDFILFIFYVSLSSICFIKSVESQNDASQSLQPFIREFPPDPFYPNGTGKMLITPGNALPDNAGTTANCTDPLPKGTYPLPRCVSNAFAYNLGSFDIERKSGLRSKRRTSHMITWFGQYISFDITGSKNTIPSTPLYIPADDATYNPPNSIPGGLSAVGSLPFNLSETSPDTPDPLNSVRNGINHVTPFLDLNTVYGVSDSQLASLRDGTSCKMLTSDNGRYPLKDAAGNYKWGATSVRSWSLFTLAINTMWIREHNRLCDELFNEYGDSWTDQQYFDEAKRWNIAFYQKATSEEYLGVILGHPLSIYDGYKPDSVPGIDTFFATIAFRYGHTELSDVFRIQDEYGDTIADLSLNQIKQQSLLETFGLIRVLSSMALQRQEEVDTFFSDAVRNVISPEPNTYDLPAFDISRARDRGIALYNVVRNAYGLPRKNTWNEITTNKYIQDKLQLLYPNGPDTVEAYVGAFCEDHLDGSNFGELLHASFVTQFNRIRETDKFWWESPDRFNDKERAILRNTTFRDIIIRNLKIDGVDGSQFVRNIWTVQPQSVQQKEDEDAKYPNKISSWTPYSIEYRMDDSYIHFKVRLQTAEGEGWFGMGFEPSDSGMKDAEFIIGIVSKGDIDLSYYNAAEAGYHPPLKNRSEGLEIKNKKVDPNGVATIEFSRLLAPPNHKPIRRGQMKYIMAYNPTSSGFSYHGNNRQMQLIDFYLYQISATTIAGLQKTTRLLHGIGMFLTWCLLFPVSIFIVRFLKHTDNHMKVHRTIQVLGGISVSTFGAAAIATWTSNRSPHAWLGLIIYTLVFFQLGLGLAAIWGQAAVVSVNHGYPRFAKRTHKAFGVVLLVASWVNIYFGFDTYTQSYSINPIIFRISYAIWIFILILAFIVGECWFWWRKRSLGALNMCGSSKKLLEFTWEDINDRVQTGALLVVCDGYVVDVGKWMGIHPGGARILEKVIGTDITDDFHNKHRGKNIVPNMTPQIQKVSILEKNQTAADLVDKINLKYFSNSPLANHEHSAFAMKKMLCMAIGKMKESQDDMLEPEKEENTIAQRIKFRRYKLMRKLQVNDSKEYPMIKFIFTRVHNDDSTSGGKSFLPGQYVEVQSRVNAQVVVRSYTPVEGSMSETFTIYVKVYHNGLLSRHLNEQLIGFEIQVRGPFDVSDRFKLATASQASNRRSMVIPPLFSMKENSSLVNPNGLVDKCWDELFMICGGSGITPMLQLIKYHIEAKKGDRKIQMHLLYGNRHKNDFINDLRDPDFKKYVYTLSKGKLTVKHVASNRMTPDVIRKWFNEIDPTIPESPQSPQSQLLSVAVEPKASKIIVCGSADMILTVDQTLAEMGFSEDDYILLV